MKDERERERVKLPIRDPAVLINLIGEALCAAAADAGPECKEAVMFDLVWNLDTHRFRAVPRRPKNWDYNKPWTQMVDIKCELIVKGRMLGMDVREGPTSPGWWKLLSLVAYSLEQRRIFIGPWPRMKC